MKALPVFKCARARQWFSAALSLLLLSALLSGCASLPVKDTLPELPADPNTPTYKVLIPAKLGAPKVFVGRLDRNKTVQDALAESGVLTKYKHLMIDLARAVPEKGQVLRLQASFDPGLRMVIPQEDYALHPGDEILVRPGGSGPLDSMMRAVAGQETVREPRSVTGR